MVLLEGDGDAQTITSEEVEKSEAKITNPLSLESILF